jgi:hypothetical protein
MKYQPGFSKKTSNPVPTHINNNIKLQKIIPPFLDPSSHNLSLLFHLIKLYMCIIATRNKIIPERVRTKDNAP